jgi:hypothetical protein
MSEGTGNLLGNLLGIAIVGAVAGTVLKGAAKTWDGAKVAKNKSKDKIDKIKWF